MIVSTALVDGIRERLMGKIGLQFMPIPETALCYMALPPDDEDLLHQCHQPLFAKFDIILRYFGNDHHAPEIVKSLSDFNSALFDDTVESLLFQTTFFELDETLPHATSRYCL